MIFFGFQILQICNLIAEGLEQPCIGSAGQGQLGRPCTVGTSISDEEILAIGQQLWDNDENSIEVELNLQGKAARDNSDRAAGPLCRGIPKEIFSTPVYKDFMALFDNYIADDSKTEQNTASERNEIDALLDTVMKTGPLIVLHEFLASKGLVSKDVSKFRDALKNAWFSPYKRSKVLSSSGAEHVLIGEIKDGKISGLHNWVRYCLLERKQNINYLGYEKKMDLNGAYLIKATFLWDNHLKSGGSFFVGTSPAFDLSIFTLCFYARPNQKCKLKLSGQLLKVQTYTINYNGQTMIGSAYPEF